MSDRDEIANLIDDAVPGGVPGYRHRYGLAAANAIIARFPYITADQSLYDYAASLRQQLLDTRAELDQLRGHA